MDTYTVTLYPSRHYPPLGNSKTYDEVGVRPLSGPPRCLTLSFSSQVTDETIGKVAATILELNFANEQLRFRTQKYTLYGSSEQNYFDHATSRVQELRERIQEVKEEQGFISYEWT